MGRPIKKGLDYFPLDVDIFSDEKMAPICVEYGIKGEIIVIHLLCAIYRNGYFIEWTDMMKYKLSKDMPGVSVELLEQVVGRLVKWGFFEQTLFDTAKVLTSAGIQRRYIGAIRKRNRRDFSKLPHWLLPSDDADAQPKRTPSPKLKAPAPAQAPATPLSAPALKPFIVGNKANDECLQRLFDPANRANLEVYAMQLGLSPENMMPKMQDWASRVVAYWNVTEQTHHDYSDWCKHLMLLMHKEKDKDAKAEAKAKRTQQPTTPPTPTDYSFGGGFGGQDT